MTPDETEELILETWNFSDPNASHDAFQAHVEHVGMSSLPGMALQTQAARSACTGSPPRAEVTFR